MDTSKFIPEDLENLISDFTNRLSEIKSPNYKEARLRNDFLDKLFNILGWDLSNTKGLSEKYREVIIEDSLNIEGFNKSPDYAFCLGGKKKFFVEAKTPTENLETNKKHAYQLRRYGWSTKLPICLLTDFEEFAIYDCRVKPSENDSVTEARILYFKIDQIKEYWDQFINLFSRQAVQDGLLDKYIESEKSKRGTLEVDKAFLEDIDLWRKDLAKNLAKNNPNLTQYDLNLAVQLTINRIIFLRICEDRGIEDYGKLQTLDNGTNTYKRLLEFFERADDKYNSGLFHFREEKGRSSNPDNITPNLNIDDEVLKKIFSKLYFPKSPYVFSEIPADILGQVYEQFLGKIISLNSKHEAQVEEKPEVRKAGGVYYTPTYIVEYIVKNTVGKLLERKTPNLVSKIHILDPACGSGSFLIQAYQYLLDWHLDYYLDEKYFSEKLYKGKNPILYQNDKGDWKLTTEERKRILVNNIFGVDIDHQAVEMTKLSLLLKVLEGETEQSVNKTVRLFQDRVLPDLGNNIKCGNSLIENDFYSNEQQSIFELDEKLKVNAFDWEIEFKEIFDQGGFDVIIGNPPYDVLEKDRSKSSWPHQILQEYAKNKPEFKDALGGKLNLFRFFLVKSKILLSLKGIFGMIVPLSLLADISCSSTRKYLIGSTINLQADCFPQKDNPKKRVFLNAKLSTVIIKFENSIQNTLKNKKIDIRTYPWNSFDDKCKKSIIYYQDLILLDPKNIPIPLVNSDEWELCKKIYKNTYIDRLSQIKDYIVTRGEINQTIFRKYITPDSNKATLLKGVQIAPYSLNIKLSQGQKEWFDENAFLKDNSPKSVAYKKRLAIQRITGVDEKLRIVSTLIEPDPVIYFADSTNSITKREGSKYNLTYLLSLLNSKFFQWRFRLTSTNNNVGTNELESMPFRKIDFSVSSDVEIYLKISGLAQLSLNLNKQISDIMFSEKDLVKRQLKSIDLQINQLVYQLYNLTDDETKIVEGETNVS